MGGSGRQSKGGDTLSRGGGRGVAKQLGVEGEGGGGSGGWMGDRGVTLGFPLLLMGGGGVETEGETGDAEVTGVLTQLDAQFDLKKCSDKFINEVTQAIIIASGSSLAKKRAVQ